MEIPQEFRQCILDRIETIFGASQEFTKKRLNPRTIDSATGGPPNRSYRVSNDADAKTFTVEDALGKNRHYKELPYESIICAAWTIYIYGKTKKGVAVAKGAKLGNVDLSLDSVEGAVAYWVFGKEFGESVFRRITPIKDILVCLGLVLEGRGYLEFSREIFMENQHSSFKSFKLSSQKENQRVIDEKMSEIDQRPSDEELTVKNDLGAWISFRDTESHDSPKIKIDPLPYDQSEYKAFGDKIARHMPQLYAQYQWRGRFHGTANFPSEDSHKNGFPWITKLEDRFGDILRHPELITSGDILEVIKWQGAPRNLDRRFQSRIGDEEIFNRSLQGTFEDIKHAIESDQLPVALFHLMTLPSVGITTGSQILRFMIPSKAGAYSSIIWKGLINLIPHKENASDIHLMSQEYASWLELLKIIRDIMEAEDIYFHDSNTNRLELTLSKIEMGIFSIINQAR